MKRTWQTTREELGWLGVFLGFGGRDSEQAFPSACPLPVWAGDIRLITGYAPVVVAPERSALSSIVVTYAEIGRPPFLWKR